VVVDRGDFLTVGLEGILAQNTSDVDGSNKRQGLFEQINFFLPTPDDR